MSITASLLCACIIMPAAPAGQEENAVSYTLESMPEGFRLQIYDDCGIGSRQPHVLNGTFYEFPTYAVNADQPARTVVTDPTDIGMRYEGLDPALDYVLAVTYASEPSNERRQSLWADGIELHGPRDLPLGRAERLLFRVPPEAMDNGRLELHFRREGPVNTVVSIVELWAPAPSPDVVHLDQVSGLFGPLTGQVSGLDYAPLAGAEVQLRVQGAPEPLAATQSGEDGSFAFAREVFADSAGKDTLELRARYNTCEDAVALSPAQTRFEPVHFRPAPSAVEGLSTVVLSLDGAWRLNPEASPALLDEPLDSDTWRSFTVPGQFLQQGFDIPRNQSVALATAFSIPLEWAGRRMILRFDGVHGGARYWINGEELGTSERLFTPIEWDISPWAKPGATNRLDMTLTVDTVSEQFSFSSNYAFHNLGGIDRKVTLFALPPVHVNSLRLDAQLDEDYRDGVLDVEVGIANATNGAASGLSLTFSAADPQGREIRLTPSHIDVGAMEPGTRKAHLRATTPRPAQWSAEHPNLCTLSIALKRDGEVIERIERPIGFRTVEIREAQMYVNGRRVKLAGACRHEVDGLTGRANTARHAEQDAELFKQANLNYIRTSHYPPTEEFIQAADRVGLYLEVEAPFCWVGGDVDLAELDKVLDPTSAMIDFCHAHPSVMLWSIANESSFNRLFEKSEAMCKKLDPTRPTTFNNPDPKRICDIANLHYAPMPYDQHMPDDPRPIVLGEYNFPICHEQTDVGVNPGLRELWGAGHADPNSEWGRYCATSYDDQNEWLHPGTPPGTWTYIQESQRVIGGAIWAALDDSFYFPDGTHAGYSWHHGFWGLIDVWRRPKPEFWLSKLVHSPVWFLKREAEWSPGQAAVAIPVENRYAFTDLSELDFAWQSGAASGTVQVSLAPGERGAFEIPVPENAQLGDAVTLRVTDHEGRLVNSADIVLGGRRERAVPQPSAGAPEWSDDGRVIRVNGQQFSLVLDRSQGVFQEPGAGGQVMQFPMVHVSRFDFADLRGGVPPYAVFPEDGSRVVEKVEIKEEDGRLAITVHDVYPQFKGAATWLIDEAGMGRISYDYVYTGEKLYARELGVRFLLAPACGTVSWERWSEWGPYPEDQIGRPAGVAQARRGEEWPKDRSDEHLPAWPWSLDQNEFGTSDFRAMKFCIYKAALQAADGSGLCIHADADAHVRAALAPNGVWFHIVSECKLGPLVIDNGSRIAGTFCVELLPAGAPMPAVMNP